MTALLPQRRKKTARELAEINGVTVRTIQRLIAEPRNIYLMNAEEKATKVLHLRITGKKIKDISEELNIPVGTVSSIISKAKKEGRLQTNLTLLDMS